MAHLRIQLPEGEVIDHPLEPGRTTLGRSSNNDVVISDLALSRNHAVVFSRGDQFFVEDAGSRNGTFVNQAKIGAPVGLRHGDMVRIGASRIQFSTDETSPSGGKGLPSDSVTWSSGQEAGSESPSVRATRYLLIQQLDLAREIQGFLLPHAAPVLPGYRIAGDTQPCYEVGGDFFDYHPMADGRVVFVVADVARKGIGAALLGHYSQAYLRGAVSHEQRIEDLVAKLNDEIAEHSPPNQYLDATFCVLDPGPGTLTYVTAGHCAPFLVRAYGGTERLEGGNLLVGIVPGAAYEPGRALMERGDMLVLYTDGIIECTNRRDSEYGAARFEAFMARRASASPEAIMRDLEAELEGFAEGRRPGDDITIMIVQRTG
ncbi:MAG TPA: SpoIIE family protein phosphatase [Candidatus Saccharimonadales bacterium]|nr:SpoIIE family protein phosphatase [Candidatus Saccharimonadales bacterium]